MRKTLCGVGGFFLYILLSILVVGSYCDPKEVCQPRNSTYKIADSKQCDMYHDCGKSGKLLERLCDDGFVFSEEIRGCDYPHNVNCSGREKLQESPSINPECPRMNGFYPFPPADSYQKFHHCLEGKAYEKTCPEGVIFDPSKGTCMHPDRSRRPECSARTVLNFTCPNYGKKFVRLRFGDHDRLAHPTNCRKFFICLFDGKPRVGGCPLGKVFNPKLGVCDSPKKVLECKDYYGKKDLDKLAKIAELGEEGLVNEEDLDAVEDEIPDLEEHHQEAPQEIAEEVQTPQQKGKAGSKPKKFQSTKRSNSGAPSQQLPFTLNATQSSPGGPVQFSPPNRPSKTKSKQDLDASDDEDE